MSQTTPQIKIDESLAFQFFGVDDTGPESGAHCPHCGAEGRYIYHWYEYGKPKAAMAGCYKALTGQIKKNDVDNHIERIAVKQAKNKKLNGWDNTIIRMLKYISSNSEDQGKVSWANNNIWQAVRDAKAYQFGKR